MPYRYEYFTWTTREEKFWLYGNGIDMGKKSSEFNEVIKGTFLPSFEGKIII